MELTAEILFFLALIAFVAGSIDAMAGGGGLLTLPALMAAGLPPVAAVATNKLQSTFGTGGAFLAFASKGHIDFKRFAVPAIMCFLGSAAGAWALQFANSSCLMALMPVLLIAVALYFLLAPPMTEARAKPVIGLFALSVLITAIGFYDGFFGPGTGSFLTAAMVGLGGFGLIRAIAHSKLFNFASNLAALTVLAVGGHVLWQLGFIMAAASILGNQLGARLAMRFGGRGVRPLLVVMSLGLTIKLLLDSDNPLRVLLLGP